VHVETRVRPAEDRIGLFLREALDVDEHSEYSLGEESREFIWVYVDWDEGAVRFDGSAEENSVPVHAKSFGEVLSFGLAEALPARRRKHEDVDLGAHQRCAGRGRRRSAV
jgi:hypothetical protein